ncbi:MAG: type II secretion system protein [Candidatus Niyogibacteria bacterium]|nr:type II secretion system protein [Candidatus Niyogibacteria bacterium]
MTQPQKGMTILEIMTSAALVIIIGGAFFFVFWKMSAKSRDLQREQDVKQIQNALNLYITSVGRFPVCGGDLIVNGIDDCLTVELKRLGVLAGVPADPLKNKDGKCGAPDSHVYCYGSLDGSDYVLKYNLETDGIAGHASGWNSVSP